METRFFLEISTPEIGNVDCVRHVMEFFQNPYLIIVSNSRTRQSIFFWV